MSSKYVRGVRRNQIIQRWLQGIEDPEFEVFPTKKECKYIVKLRESPCKTNESAVVENIPDCPQDTPESDHTDLDTREPEPVTVQSTPRSRVTVMRSNGVDSTINLEILEQLRNLGEEIRNDRFKREQKQYIKHAVNKDINKSRIRSKYVPELFPENEPVDEPPTKSEPDVPQTDNTVDAASFSFYSSLKQIIIPTSVNSIEGSVFSGCNK
ncbi:hypothetical protein M9Y10_024489 [Tritrichomonas musculus]|uniref:Uncharacterized protein n=1 Tax=Tritrichomonas musculus TaxID=1915356 RepID=A0ABR2HC50_9EUKA